jgi:hypothetical protein
VNVSGLIIRFTFRIHNRSLINFGKVQLCSMPAKTANRNSVHATACTSNVLMQNWAVGPPAEGGGTACRDSRWLRRRGGGTACRRRRWLRRRPKRGGGSACQGRRWLRWRPKQGRWDRLPGLPLASPAAKTRAVGPPARVAAGFAGGQNKGGGTACRDCRWLRWRLKQGRWDRLPRSPLASPAAKAGGGLSGI